MVCVHACVCMCVCMRDCVSLEMVVWVLTAHGDLFWILMNLVIATPTEPTPASAFHPIMDEISPAVPRQLWGFSFKKQASEEVQLYKMHTVPMSRAAVLYWVTRYIVLSLRQITRQQKPFQESFLFFTFSFIINPCCWWWFLLSLLLFSFGIFIFRVPFSLSLKNI